MEDAIIFIKIKNVIFVNALDKFFGEYTDSEIWHICVFIDAFEIKLL